MVVKSGRFLWRMAEGLLAALGLGLAALAIALAQGPIEVPTLTHALAEAISDSLPGMTLNLDSVALAFDRTQKHVVFQARDLSLINTASQAVIARFPEADVELSMRALGHGILAPARITLRGAELNLRRDGAGRLNLGLDAASSGSAGPGDGDAVAWLNEVLAMPEGGGIAPYIKTVALADAKVRVIDEGGGVDTQGRLSLALARTPVGLALDGQLKFAQGGLQVDVTYDRNASLLVVRGALDKIVPGELAGVDHAMAKIAGVMVPISGRFEASLEAGQRIKSAQIDLTAGAGAILWLDLWPSGLKLDTFTLAARYDGSADRVSFDKVMLGLGGAQITMKGDAGPLVGANAPDLNLDLDGRGLSLEQVLALWPPDAAPGGRSWIARNMKAGGFQDLVGRVRLRAEQWQGPTPAEAIDLTFSFQGLRTQFLGGLPPLDKAKGRAHLTATSLDVEVDEGTVGALTLSQGKVALTAFDKPVAQGQVQANLAGTMAETMRILDYEPLGYARKFDLDPQCFAGSQTTTIAVRLPLIEALRVEQVEIDVKGKTRDLGLPKLVGSRDLSNADLDVKLDKRHLEAKGTARLAGVAMNVAWREEFEAPKAKPSSFYAIDAALDDDDRERLGIGLGWRLRGVTGVKLDVVGRGGALQTGKAEVNLDAALIDLPELDLEPGLVGRGQASFDLAFPPSRIALRNIKLRAGALSGRGDIVFDNAGLVQSARLQDVRVGEASDLDLNLSRAGDGLSLEVTGRKFNATGLLDVIAEPEDPKAPDVSVTPYRFHARLAQTVLADEAPPLREVTVAGHHDGKRLVEFKAAASTGAKGKVDMAIVTKSAAARGLSITSDDAGALLETVGIFDEGAGGNFDLAGAFDDSRRDGPVKGEVKIKDMRVLRAPVLFRLLTLASPQGAVDTFQGSGILFSDSGLKFSSQGGSIYLSDGLFSGPMVTVSLSGLVDQRSDNLDLKGALVPLAMLNSFLGDVPLIGDLLVGRKGEGIIGLDYAITGPSDNPKISVNPLSILTPGFLKRIFDFGAPKPPAEPQARP